MKEILLRSRTDDVLKDQNALIAGCIVAVVADGQVERSRGLRIELEGDSIRCNSAESEVCAAVGSDLVHAAAAIAAICDEYAVAVERRLLAYGRYGIFGRNQAQYREQDRGFCVHCHSLPVGGLSFRRMPV